MVTAEQLGRTVLKAGRSAASLLLLKIARAMGGEWRRIGWMKPQARLAENCSPWQHQRFAKSVPTKEGAIYSHRSVEPLAQIV